MIFEICYLIFVIVGSRMRKFDIKNTSNYITKSLADEIRTRGVNKGVVGVSGGLDSAVVVKLLSLSIGSENAIGVIMPSVSTSQADIDDALEMTGSLNVKTYIIDVSPMIERYFKNFPDADRVRRGNKMARERMSILYDISQFEKALVIGTGNKAEYYLGYFTLWGDGSYAINPIGDLYKCEVRQLARYIGVPEKIISKAPSAGLWITQTDEEELGYSYGEIDELLYNIVDLKSTKEKLLDRGFELNFVENILHRIENSEFKRLPPYIIKIPHEIKYADKP